MIGSQVNGLSQLRRRQHLDLRDRATGGEGCALPLSDVHMFIAATQFRASGIDRDFLLVRGWIAAHCRAAIGAHGSDRIFKRNFGF